MQNVSETHGIMGGTARVRDAISPILRYSKLFAAILGPECLVDFLFKGFLIIGCVPVPLLVEEVYYE